MPTTVELALKQITLSELILKSGIGLIGKFWHNTSAKIYVEKIQFVTNLVENVNVNRKESIHIQVLILNTVCFVNILV